MIPRLQQLPANHSYFLFGARGTGKSTYLEHKYPPDKHMWINLLNPAIEKRFANNPEELIHVVAAMPNTSKHIIIDEIQKVPKLLDVVQLLLKDKQKHFVMTGSSARKLKRDGANLLAGRAFVYHLYPFSYLELENNFDLKHMLTWGSLPEIYDFSEDGERKDFLNAYAHTYLKEEIWNEHIIRNLDPFRKFLEVAAQTNGKIINFANIAREIGVDNKTVKSYFSILKDTLIGFFLEPYHHSLRKKLSGKPKFYFFDPGVVRALAMQMDIPLRPGNHAYGNAFEHFIIIEMMRLSDYLKKNYKFSYVRTVNDVEIDLVIERPGKTTLFIEIKSTSEIQKQQLTHFKNITHGIENSEAICLSNDPFSKKFDHVIAHHWKQGLEYIFNLE